MLYKDNILGFKIFIFSSLKSNTYLSQTLWAQNFHFYLSQTFDLSVKLLYLPWNAMVTTSVETPVTTFRVQNSVIEFHEFYDYKTKFTYTL